MAEIVSRRSIVYDILFEVEQGKKSAKEAQAALDKVDKSADRISGTMKNVGAAIAGAFAVREIANFTAEAFELGLKAEGVRRAFNGLNNPKLLSNLRAATSGLVDDLTLMQASVRADKFKIPLDTLGKLFKFASVRARETGQSVNFLVDSIIDGIGRKSPLILDNLGLRAQDLQNEFARTGDFAKAAANVISREMAASGVVVEGQAEKVLRLRTEWQNLKVEIGEGLLAALANAESGAAKFFKTISKIPGFAGFGLFFGEGGEKLAEYTKQQELAAEAAANFVNNLTNQKWVQIPFTINDIEAAISTLQAKMKDTDTASEEGRAAILNYAKQIKELEEFIKSLTEAQENLTGALERTFLKTKELSEFDRDQTILDAEKRKEEREKRQQELDEARGLTIKFAQDVGNVAEEAVRKQFELSDALKENLIVNAQDTLTALTTLFSEGSKAGLAFAGVQIFADQAKALSGAIAAATQAASTSGGFSLPLLISSFVSIALSSFAQVNALLNRARAEQATVSEAFAEGEVDIHRPGEKRGKDSIPAMIMPGESVMTTQETARYKPILEAIRSGTLEDLIHQNYVQPELAVNALDHAKNDSKELDYSERFYRQLLATGEGNGINKRALRHLQNIDKKLTTNKSYKR